MGSQPWSHASLRFSNGKPTQGEWGSGAELTQAGDGVLRTRGAHMMGISIAHMSSLRVPWEK